MKLETVEFGVQMAVSIPPNDNGKIDAVHERIQLSDTAYLDLQGLTGLQTFAITYKPIVRRRLFKDEYGSRRLLHVIAMKRKKDHQELWTFLCDSKEIFCGLANEFMLAYTLETTFRKNDMICETEEKETKISYGHAGYNAKCFVEGIEKFSNNLYGGDDLTAAYDAQCAFLCFLLKVGREKRINSVASRGQWDKDHKITGCRFSLPENRKNFAPSVERCLICESWSFNGVYQIIGSFLPQNLKRKVEWEIKQLRGEYGKDFAKKTELLESFKQSVTAQDFWEQGRKILPEIERWSKLTEDGIAEKKFGEEYVAVLGEKMKILEDVLRLELKKCDFDPGQEEQCKDRLLKRLGNIHKGNHDREMGWYQEYCSREAWLKEMAEHMPGNMAYLKIPQYYAFYHHGKILIGNRMRQLTKDGARKNPVSEKELDDAMVYFYETDTAQEAYRLEKRIENRKKGMPGEKEVDYVLEWLEAGGNYKRVPKIWSKKDREKMIRLYNPAFIKKPQEYDQIIVGKQGVFVIETKNYEGKLIVDANGNWIREKRDGTRGGEKNPVQQVDRHVKLLQSILEDGILVIGVICIAHPKAILEGVENCSVPLVKSDLLHEFIEKYPSGEKMLSKEEMENCLLRIEEHRYQR